MKLIILDYANLLIDHLSSDLSYFYTILLLYVFSLFLLQFSMEVSYSLQQI